jgi:rSAM/selenodomain-associated transferase 2
VIPWALATAGWLISLLVLAAASPLGRLPLLSAGGYLAGFAGLLAMVHFWPERWSPRRTLVVMALLVVGIRLIFWATPPGNDLNRYVWEGVVQNWGVNPYRVAPAHADLDFLAQGPLRGIRDGVNHPELPAIYPPLPLLAFRALAAAAPDPRLFKGFFLLLDLALAILLARMLWLEGHPLKFLLLYAANPLVIVFVAGEGHMDVLQALLVVAGVHLLDRRHPAAGFLCLGSAVMSKFLALALIPMMINRRTGPWAWTALVPLLAYAPFWEARDAWWRVLGNFAGDFHYNDALTTLLRVLAGRTALFLAAGVLMATLALILLTVPQARRRVYLAAGAVLLCLPTLHPWYLLLVAPFMVFSPSRPWLFLMAAMAGTFPVMGLEYHTGVFQEIHWLKWCYYVPFCALLLQAARRDTRLWPLWRFPAPRSLSVVIPTLEEGPRIEACVDSVEPMDGLVEVVVSDGGSRDDTRERARRLGCRVVAGPPGRGGQIRRGLEAATGDAVLVLHADSRLAPGTLARVMEALRRNPQAPGGACGMRFAGGGTGMRLIAWLNNRRAEFFGIAFGDQAQFFRREALTEAGGYPGLPLMEDVELSLQLKTQGRPLFLPHAVEVSHRRWQRRGFVRNLATVGSLLLHYLWERRWYGPGATPTDYYRRYYRHLQ